MKQFEYTIKDPVGIHARPAGLLGKKAKEFEGTTVTIEKGDKSAAATKLMALMGLGVKCGDTIKFTVEGDDEEAAAKAIEEFMNANL